MFDLKISGGLVVDGTGVAGQVMDIGIVGDRIVAMGDLSDEAAREIDASGRIVTPGFVDIHTHYDGQATWDPEMAPSSWHGVTTVVMGNCGVGFAPAAPDKREWLVGLMALSLALAAPDTNETTHTGVVFVVACDSHFPRE